MTPTAIYAFALGSYFILMILIGVYHLWKIESADEYLIANWRVGFWQILGTTVATWSGSAVFIGFVGMGFAAGLNGFFYWVLPGCLFTILFVRLVGRILQRLQLYTIPDLFALRFGKNAAFLPAIYQIFIYSIPTLAIQFIGLGITFQVFFGLELHWGIILAFGLVSLYTLLGGMPSTILTDCVQAAVIVIGHVAMFVFCIRFAGGFERIFEITPAAFWHPLGSEGFGSFLSVAFTIGPFYMVWQTTWQRIFASRNDQTAVSGVTWGFAINLLLGLMSFMIGLAARGYLPQETPPELVFTTAVSHFFPPYAGALVVLGLAAALMSGADSFTMMGSASMARDIYQQYFNPKASRREMLTVSRSSVVLMSVAAAVVALIGSGIIPLYVLVVKICGAGLVFPVMAMLFWRRATRAGVLAGMIAGGAVTVIWHFLDNPFIMDAVSGYLASMVATLLVSLATRHAVDEQVGAVFFDDLDVSDYHNHFGDWSGNRKKLPPL